MDPALVEASTDTDRATAPIAGRPGGLTVDLPVIVVYLLTATWVTARLWLHPDTLVVATNDQMLFEWMLARAAHAVAHLENPLYSTALGAPVGVNLMANTSVLGLGVPLAPVTLLFGSRISFLVALVVSLSATAAAWYVFLSRRIVRSRFAAAAGGLFCGFAPGMISQAAGHLHMTAQFLVPFILWLALLPRDGRVLRPGLLLGLLVSYQVFLGEEALVFLALAAGLFVVAYAAFNPRCSRRLAGPLLARLGTGALVAVPLLAYPLWFQFFGPSHYRGLPFDPGAYTLDAASFAAMARQSLAGNDAVPGLLSPNASEENSFFGLPLLALFAVVVLWRWRSTTIKALAVCAVTFAILSFGVQVQVNGDIVGPGPYRLISGLPLIGLALPARFPLVLIPVVAVVLAIATDKIVEATARKPYPEVPIRLLWIGAVVAVLLPLAPMPMATKPLRPVPEFIASGQWRSYVPPGRTLVPVPPIGGQEGIAGVLWSARTGLDFAVPSGYFIGPSGPDDMTARWGPPMRPTAELLGEVIRTGKVPAITDGQRRQAVEDLRYWRAAVVVQGRVRNGDAVRRTVELLIGPGRLVSGTWVWDVRGLVG